MQVAVDVTVQAPRPEVWRVVTDIDHAERTISGIEKIEVLERPTQGLVGLKWKETRTLFGKTATEIMWITAAEENAFYETEARSHGSIYRTRIGLENAGGGTRLSMTFTAEPETFGARLMSWIFGPFVKGSTRKALRRDLLDVKTAVETRSAPPSPS